MADELTITIKGNSKHAQAAIKAYNESLDNTNKKHKKTSGILKTIKSNWLGYSAAIYAGIKIFKSVISVFADFEQAIANVASVSGGATEELAKMAREAGKSTIFSAKEAGDALYYLASAGLDVQEMSQVLTPILNLAAAAQMDIADATDLVVNNLKVFAKEQLNAQEITDMMAKTVASSNTNMAQLGEALKVAGSEAALNGIKFQDTAAIIASMANSGIKGSEAGTKLRMVLARLGADMPAVTDTLKKYGISQEEINKLLPEPIKLFKRLHDANISNSDATQIFGVRNKAVFKIVRDGIPDLEDMQKAIENSGGAAKKMADVQLNTLNSQLKLLKSAWQEIILVLTGDEGVGEALKDVIKQLVEISQSERFVSGMSIAFKVLQLTVKTAITNIIESFKILPNIFILLTQPIIEIFKGLGKIISAAFKGDFDKIGDIASDTLTKMKNDAITKVDEMIKPWKKLGTDVKNIYDIVLNDFINAEDKKTKKLEDENKKRLEKELKALEEKYKAGIISEEEYYRQKEQLLIQYEANKKAIKEPYEEEEKEKEKTKWEQFKADYQAGIETFKNFFSQLSSATSTYMGYARNAWNSLFSVISGAFDNQITEYQNGLKKETKYFDEAQKNELKALNEKYEAGVINEEDYNKQKQKIIDKYEEKRSEATEEAEKKIAKAKKKQAKMAKAQRIMETIMNMAQAIMTAYSQLGPIAGSFYTAVITALGQAQIATIMKQPIPEYQQGADFTVPEGYPNDTYPMMVESGEHVSVTPEGESRAGLIVENLYVQTFSIEDIVDRTIEKLEELATRTGRTLMLRV